MLTSLGVNFGRELFFSGGGELKPWKSKAEKFAIKIRWHFLKFARPKEKIHPKSAL